MLFLGKTQTEVKEKLKKALVEAGQVDFAKSGKYTVSTWMDEWFENVANKQEKPLPEPVQAMREVFT